jgi:hypothetical protein
MVKPIVWLPPVVPTERQRFRTFVERHDALFTALGAGIVALGFFAKEAARENARDLAATLKHGQFHYVIVQRLVSMSDDIHGMQERLVAVQFPDKRGFAESAVREAIQGTTQVFNFCR